jgi:hypothetical protein
MEPICRANATVKPKTRPNSCDNFYIDTFLTNKHNFTHIIPNFLYCSYNSMKGPLPHSKIPYWIYIHKAVKLMWTHYLQAQCGYLNKFSAASVAFSQPSSLKREYIKRSSIKVYMFTGFKHLYQYYLEACDPNMM